jgi:hypothetical protein
VRLGDVLRDRQQLRHRLEWLAEIILIEAGDDHALALIGQRVADHRQLQVEELPFVDADDLGIGVDTLEQLTRAPYRARGDPHLAVGDDVIVGIANVDRRLEDLHLLPRDLRTPQPSDKLLALPAEHAADDDFYPAVSRLAHYVHLPCSPDNEPQRAWLVHGS